MESITIVLLCSLNILYTRSISQSLSKQCQMAYYVFRIGSCALDSPERLHVFPSLWNYYVPWHLQISPCSFQWWTLLTDCHIPCCWSWAWSKIFLKEATDDWCSHMTWELLAGFHDLGAVRVKWSITVRNGNQSPGPVNGSLGRKSGMLAPVPVLPLEMWFGTNHFNFRTSSFG